MKRITTLFFFLFVGHVGYGQMPTLDYLKACKDRAQPDYIDLPESEITYPLVGLTDIHMELMTAMGEGGAGGGLFAVVEVWLVDAKGKVVYNYIHTIYPKYAPNNEAIADPDYMKYLNRNGNKALKNRFCR